MLDTEAAPAEGGFDLAFPRTPFLEDSPDTVTYHTHMYYMLCNYTIQSHHTL